MEIFLPPDLSVCSGRRECQTSHPWKHSLMLEKIPRVLEQVILPKTIRLRMTKLRALTEHNPCGSESGGFFVNGVLAVIPVYGNGNWKLWLSEVKFVRIVVFYPWGVLLRLLRISHSVSHCRFAPCCVCIILCWPNKIYLFIYLSDGARHRCLPTLR